MQKNIEDNENEIDTNDKNHQENMAIYVLLWVAIIAGFIAQFFIEPQYQFSTTMFGLIWLVGFIISVYAVFVTKQRFRDYNLLFIFMAPFAITFWLSVLVDLQESDKPTANNQVNNTTLNQAIDDIQSKGVANMHQTQTHQDIVSKTHQYLGDNPSDEKLQAYLQKMVDDTNLKLPIMVEKNVRADSMYLFGKIVMHYFTITDIQSSVGMNFDKNAVNELKAELMTTANICQNNGHILKYGVSLSFSYSAVNKDNLFDILITPQDCGY